MDVRARREGLRAVGADIKKVLGRVNTHDDNPLDLQADPQPAEQGIDWLSRPRPDTNRVDTASCRSVMGLAISAALDSALIAIDAAMPAQPTNQQRLIRAKCRGLLRGYDVKWSDSPYIPLSIEEVLVADLPNINTKGTSRTFEIAGKVDLIARYNEKTVLFDHKTASASYDIQDPNAPYWRQLAVEGQVTHYYLLLWLLGRKVDGAVWNVIKKPSINPRKLTKLERDGVISKGSWFGDPVPDETRTAIANGEDRETFYMYESRLAHDCTIERSERYFQRRQVPRFNQEIFDYARELWQHSQDMLYARHGMPTTNEAFKHFPRNSGACLLYNSPCRYLGICSGYDKPDSDRWARREWVHQELPVLDVDSEVLTNSRIRCFQTCRRKEFFDYQMGLERFDEEEKESLWFGSLWHIGQAAWWEKVYDRDRSDGGFL